MRRKVVMFLTAMMVFLALSGCGRQPAETEGVSDAMLSGAVDSNFDTKSSVGEAAEFEFPEIDDMMEQYLAKAQYGDIVSLDFQEDPISPMRMIADYLIGRQEYRDRYYIINNNTILAQVYYGGAETYCQEFFPKAICDGEWTMESLIDGYRNQTLPWVEDHNMYYLHSNDYRHCFEIADDWLWIDKIKVFPMGETLISMEPSSVLDDYQHGIWDGTTAFSTGGETKVKVNYRGCLDYEYERRDYADDYDMLQLAYTGYDDPPTFMVLGLDAMFEMSCPEFHTGDYDDYTITSASTTVLAYVDLPNGSKEGFEDALAFDYAGPEVGMYVTWSDRIELYRRGVLLETWKCDVTATYPQVLYCQENSVFPDEAHAWVSDEEIVRLLPDGKIETVIDCLTGKTYDIGEYPYLLELSLKDGKVTGYNSQYGLVDIAENIASIDYTYNILLMTSENGMCYAFEIDNYTAWENQVRENIKAGRLADTTSITTYCLGDKSWEYYLDMYKANLLDFGVYCYRK